MAGIYVHIPYCASRCIYCDFYSSKRSDWASYTEVLVREIENRKDYLEGVPPATIYIGGGTPSILPAVCLKSIVGTIEREFGLSHLKEFTLEANPDDVTVRKARLWRSLGVTRLSMGVQSFCDEHLVWMKRRHSALQVTEAVKVLRDEGFGNISIDLIFGFTGLKDDEWDYNISRALALGVEHISCYQMMGRYASDDDEVCFDQYCHLQERLVKAGYHQYEISNYCLTGFESVHNSSYWDRSPYLGLGASAHSFDGKRNRSWNAADIDKYKDGVGGGSECLADRDVFDEQIMLGLRRSSGLDMRELEATFLERKKPVLESLAQSGDIVMEKGCIRIPAAKLFVSDAIISRLFAD